MHMSFIYLFNTFTVAQNTYTECQANDSPIEYNCKISRQKTALTDTLKHTHAVSSADRVQCLALLKCRQLIQQSTARAKFRNNNLKKINYSNSNKKIRRHLLFHFVENTESYRKILYKMQTL